MEVPALVERVRNGDVRAIARAISLVENAAAELRPIMAGLAPCTGRARIIGLTGSPGVGKSTSSNALVAALRARGQTVAVLAVDPSSPFSGGALLGDRIRMQDHAVDGGVFIRSMASRGHLGGLSWATPHALRVLDAGGFDVILVETVGVGQAEVDVAGHADTTLVLVAPGMGDSVQAAKAGVLEVADIFVVNKADRDGAHVTVRELRQMTAQADNAPDEWRPPIVSTVAAKSEGVEELLERLDEHEAHMRAAGELDRRRRARARAEVEAIVLRVLQDRIGGIGGHADLDELAGAVVSGARDPYAAADELLAALSEQQG